MHVRPDRLLLTVKEAALLCGLSPRQLYELCARRDALPTGLVIRLGRSVRLSRPRLRAWLGEDQDIEDGQGTMT
jgi:predicted DNA-binding transcriptional regulator AlpA